MASTGAKKPCAKCSKGIGILTCDGCQQSFCTKHIIDHRQELSAEMDVIGQEYDLLRRDLIREDNQYDPLLIRINLWEQDSMRKIQEIAQKARNDLKESSDQNKNELKDLCKKMTEELQSSRDSGDYTELDFRLWMEQLIELRKKLEEPKIIDIVDDDKPFTFTPIRIITIKEKSNVQYSSNCAETSKPTVRSVVTFDKFIGDVKFSDHSFVATHASGSHRSTMVSVTQLYSMGTNRIRFRIEQKRNKYIFFGIINSLQEMNRAVFNSPSLYGWMAPDIRVVKSRKLLSSDVGINFDDNDEVSLTLNCTTQQISLEHHRTNVIDRLPIDLRVCSLPWRVVIAFFSQDDSVRIIS